MPVVYTQTKNQRVTTMTALTLDFLAEQAAKESPFTPDALQCQLTAQYLIPHQAELFSELLQLRQKLDATFAKHSSYPIGFCKQINDGIFLQLKAVLKQAQTPGLKAVYDFCVAGGKVRKVWGNLRNCYFQNALQMGSLYVDVSNDTVVITKPKIEILPMSDADFHALDNYTTYAKIAENYWQAEAYPNRHIPELAPMYPLLLRYPSGQWKLHCPYQSLLYSNLLHSFKPAEDFLLASDYSDKKIPAIYFDELNAQVKQAKLFGASHQKLLSNNDIQHLFQQSRTQNSQLNATLCQQNLEHANSFNATTIKAKTTQPA